MRNFELGRGDGVWRVASKVVIVDVENSLCSIRGVHKQWKRKGQLHYE